MMISALGSSLAHALEGFPDVSALPLCTMMPDPLVTNSGTMVETAGQWVPRREEMKRILEHYAIGRMPPPPGNVTGRESGARKIIEGRVDYRSIHLTFGPRQELELDIALLTPATGAPFPTIVMPSFKPLPADPEELAREYDLLLGRGYAIATFFYQQCGADRPNDRETGFFSAYPEYDWGTLAAWAWGMSRCVDFLQTQAFVDKRKFIAVGHSRLGKAALIAGAFDDRFALTAPAGSGCGGTGAYRFNGKGRGGKEGLEDATQNFPQWFVPRLAEFSGQVGKLPFDQHWFISLIAPRLFIATDGLDDPYANGNALAQSYIAAKPVYAMLGAPDHLAIHFRPGKHLLDSDDWRAILDFSDQQLRELEVKRRFDELPAAEKLH